jgi:hypothetical protein
MAILNTSFCVFETPLRLCARKKETSIGMNMTAMAMKIRKDDPEYHIMRESEANTAVSSLALMLAQANNGDRTNVTTAMIRSLFCARSIFFLRQL